MHQPIWAHRDQALGRGGGKGAFEGPHAAPPPQPARPPWLHQAWPRTPLSPHLALSCIQAPSPGSGQEQEWTQSQLAPRAAPSCLWHWAGGLALTEVQRSPHTAARAPAASADVRRAVHPGGPAGQAAGPICWHLPSCVQQGPQGRPRHVQALSRTSGQGCPPGSGPASGCVSGSLLWVAQYLVCAQRSLTTQGPPPPQDRGEPQDTRGPCVSQPGTGLRGALCGSQEAGAA